MKKKRILITGGAGFIGSNLVEHFLSQDNYVICLDNLSTGNMENISLFFNNLNFQFIQGDIQSLATCIHACNNVDYVFHQAALGSVNRSVQDPISTNNTNINGSLNILVAAKNNKVKRFIYASSSSIYGSNQSIPKQEDEIGMQLSPYAITKRTLELYANVFYKLYGLETIGLRYFNVFGKNQNEHGEYAAVIPKFINNILNNRQCEIYGDGKTSRDFTYIDNIITANELAAICVDDTIFGNNYNVACGESTSLNELYNIIVKELNSNLRPTYKDERKGDIKNSLAAIVKAQDHLKYKPTTSFKEGIIKTIKWYKNAKIRHNK